MTYIISDIHGRKDRFDDILKQINFTENDTLYILGDVIDRNPDGITLLKYIMSQSNMKMLLGNHEYMMQNALKSEEKIPVWYYNGGDITHEIWKKQSISIQSCILEYLQELPLITELEINGRKFRLVHGKSPSEDKLSYTSLEDLKHDIVWGRVKSMDRGPDHVTVIFGHTPTYHYQDDEPMKIWYGENLIGIDCGAAYTRGRLACLRLEDMKEFYSNC